MKKSLLVLATFLLAGILFSCAPESTDDPFGGLDSGHVNCMVEYMDSCYENIPKDECLVAGGSIVSYCPALPPNYCTNPFSYGSFSTVTIEGRTWMSENLNYAACGSKCYDNDPANCAKYGRLYDWATAMALPPSCNSSTCSDQIQTKHRGVCPSGWHMPSNAEWAALFAGGNGQHLKATSGWNYEGRSGNGMDPYGFAALPGGESFDSDFGGVGFIGSWWSSYEINSSDAHSRLIYIDGGTTVTRWSNDKSFLYSVRCVQD
jgi:uncharacterized protein (TIGR02145 family)